MAPKQLPDSFGVDVPTDLTEHGRVETFWLVVHHDKLRSAVKRLDVAQELPLGWRVLCEPSRYFQIGEGDDHVCHTRAR